MKIPFFLIYLSYIYQPNFTRKIELLAGFINLNCLLLMKL